MSQNEKKHTPGPWHACCADKVPHYVFDQSAEKTICQPLYNDPAHGKYEPACDTLTVEEMRANALLIAASPDLLEALEQCLQTLVDSQKVGPLALDTARGRMKWVMSAKKTADMARAAIAKATNKTQA